MAERPLDRLIETLSDRLMQLDARKVAAYSASCSERFAGLYEEFVSKEHWGNPAVIREGLDTAWTFLYGGSANRADLEAQLTRIDLATPHADDFESLEATLAQDACISVDSTVRWCLEEPGLIPHAVTYSFEAIRAAISDGETGYLDLGNGPDAARFEDRLVQDSRVQKELAFQESDLQHLVSSHLTPDVVSRLRVTAQSNRWTVGDLAANAGTPRDSGDDP